MWDILGLGPLSFGAANQTTGNRAPPRDVVAHQKKKNTVGAVLADSDGRGSYWAVT